MSNLKFAETHNLIVFLEKPEESDGFEGIIDFLNASSIRYALTIQALVDGKKIWKEWVLRLLLGTNLVALWPLLSSVLPEIKISTFPSTFLIIW
ncbi:hypothetical protein Tco_1037851 [Tanacetum coccineum]